MRPHKSHPKNHTRLIRPKKRNDIDGDDDPLFDEREDAIGGSASEDKEIIAAK